MYENNGVRYSVVHGTSESTGESFVIGLYPSHVADYEARVVFSRTEYTEKGVLSLLAHYFKTVRGYPKMTLDIIINGRKTELSIGEPEE